METFGESHSRYLDPPDIEDCYECAKNGCNGMGLIIGTDGTGSPADECCFCDCHESPEVLRQMEADRKYKEAKEG